MGGGNGLRPDRREGTGNASSSLLSFLQGEMCKEGVKIPEDPQLKRTARETLESMGIEESNFEKSRRIESKYPRKAKPKG